MKWVLIAVLILGISDSTMAQRARLEGRIIDESGRAVPGANVLLLGTDSGVASSPDGTFVLEEISPGTYEVSVSAVGFRRQFESVTFGPGETVALSIVLTEALYLSGEVVVTALRRPEITALVPVSVSVIGREQLDQRNFTSLDDALRLAPGVQVAENQISVRGSSGFSYNVGSRVLLLVDGVPMLGPETGGVPFDLIPVPRIERIEIIKGPGSALYGSGALGGIINIITAEIPPTTEYSLRVSGGVHDPVRHALWRDDWPEASNFRAFGGLSASYARRVGRFVGGWVHVAYRADPGYLRANRDQMFQAYSKLSWFPSDRITLNVLGGATVRERDSFLYWNGIRDALSPGNLDLLSPGGTDATGANDNHSLQLSILPSLRHLLSSSVFYQMRLRLFHIEIRPIDEQGNLRTLERGTAGYRFGGEWQLDWAPSGEGYVTAGLSADANAAKSEFFQGEGGGLRFGQPELGAFLQYERSMWDRVNVLAGLRFDAYQIDTTTTASRLTPKLSASVSLSESVVLRGSFGQGFRVPGIAERYINNQDFFPFFPNHRLRPEVSTGFEIGLRSLVSTFRRWSIRSDLALFWSDYDHLVEPKFITDPAASGLTSYGFQFVNLVRARIRGAEASVEGRNGRGANVSASYTLLDASDRLEQTPLAFRSAHLAKLSLTTGLWRRIGLGIDYRYASRPQRVDTDFAAFVRDADIMVPVHVVDARVEYARSNAALALIVNNLLDYYYVERPAYLAPPRRASLQLRLHW